MNRDSLTILVKKFHQFEIENELFDKKINGKYFWDYIRLNTFEGMIHRKHGGIPYPPSPKKLKAIFDLSRYLLGLLFDIFKGKKQYDIFLINYDRNNIINDKALNIHMHYFAKLEDRYRILLIDPYDGVQSKTDYPCDIYRARPMYLFARFKSILTKFSNNDQLYLNNLSKQKKIEFNVDLNILELAKNIFSYQVILDSEYIRLFNKYKPKLILYCDNGSMKGILEAAYKSKITRVDFQHSLISSINILYNYPSSILSKTKATNPEYIFTFGTYWHKNIETISKKVPIGFPYLESQIKKLKIIDVEKREKSIIIISMLTGNAKELLVNTAIGLAKELPEWTIYYKLRNTEYNNWQANYPKDFRRDNIIVIDSNRPTLYQLFSKCRIQISTNSTAVYEGLAFGLKTYIFKVGWYEEMEYLYNNDYAYLISSPKEVIMKIKQGFKKDNCLKLNHLFLENSMKNLRKTINGLLS